MDSLAVRVEVASAAAGGQMGLANVGNIQQSSGIYKGEAGCLAGAHEFLIYLRKERNVER